MKSISDILSETMILRARDIFDKFDWKSSGTLAMEVRRKLYQHMTKVLNYRQALQSNGNDYAGPPSCFDFYWKAHQS
jgi:hypothetical protein